MRTDGPHSWPDVGPSLTHTISSPSFSVGNLEAEVYGNFLDNILLYFSDILVGKNSAVVLLSCREGYVILSYITFCSCRRDNYIDGGILCYVSGG